MWKYVKFYESKDNKINYFTNTKLTFRSLFIIFRSELSETVDMVASFFKNEVLVTVIKVYLVINGVVRVPSR